MSRTRWIGFLMIFAFTGLAACTRGCGQNQSEGNDVLNVDRGFQFPPGFPPDPGEAGRRTLEGIDSDHDGLRDDVQRWIYARFPNDERKRKALRQVALWYQFNISKEFSEQDIPKSNKQFDRALTCFMEVFGEDVDSFIDMDYVKAKFLNTFERTQRFLKNDAIFDGTTAGPTYPRDGTECEQ